MSNTQFGFLANNPNNFTPAQKIKIFTSERFPLGAAIPSYTLTLAAAVTQGATSITVSAGFPEILYEGTRLNFGTEETPDVVYVAEETAANDTTIAIEPARTAIDNASVATVKAYIPFFGAKNYNLDAQPQAITDSVFSDGLFPEQAVEMINQNGSVNGTWVFLDPAMEQFIPAVKDGLYVYLEIIYPGQRGGRHVQGNLGIAEVGEKNQMIQRNITILPTGYSGYLSAA